MFIKQDVDFETAKKHIEKGNVVFTEGRYDRATGKTTAIVAYSIWTGKPIITGNRQWIKLYKSYNPQVEVVLANDVRGTSGSSFLVDESVSLEQFDLLKEQYNLSGFMNVSGGM